MPKRSNPKKPKRHAVVLPPIYEEMKQWSTMLGTELESWPKVTSKPMFGMTAYYRGEQMFAILPKTRGFQSPNSVGFRMETRRPKTVAKLQADPRVISNPIGHKWVSYEVGDAKDLNAALEWLSRAYEDAPKKKTVRPRKKN